MTQKERQMRSKQEILLAAHQEFGQYGYSKVTIESICTKYKISKGMMYHYYSNKDDLFLTCVQQTFEQMKSYIEQHFIPCSKEHLLEDMKHYFMMRQSFFQKNPTHKRIFEDAILHPPAQLKEKIWDIREPMRLLNQDFIHHLVKQIPLRSGLTEQKVTHYLQSMEYVFQSFLSQYPDVSDLDDILQTAEDILDMMIFGITKEW